MGKKETPLDGAGNFGPVTLPEFKRMGLTTVEQLRGTGWEGVCRMWVQWYPERLNANAFIGVIAAIAGISWKNISPEQRKMAHDLAARMREEKGIAKGKKPARRNRD